MAEELLGALTTDGAHATEEAADQNRGPIPEECPMTRTTHTSVIQKVLRVSLETYKFEKDVTTTSGY